MKGVLLAETAILLHLETIGVVLLVLRGVVVAKSELKKVVWPSKQDVKTNTIVVLVTVAIAAVVMILLDAIFGGILGLIIGA